MRVGIDLSGSEALVAVHREGRARLVVLGPLGVTFPLCAHRNRSGVVVVGSRALEAASVEPIGFVPDVRVDLDGDPTAQPLLVSALVEELVGRVAASESAAPVALVVVHADDLPAAAVSRLLDAARHAGPWPVSTIASAEARARSEGLEGVDPSHRGALGASIPPASPATERVAEASSLPASDAVVPRRGASVFEADDDWADVGERTSAMAQVSDLDDEGLDGFYEERSARGWWIALGVCSLTVIAALAAVLVITSGGDTDEVAVPGASTTALVPPATDSSSPPAPGPTSEATTSTVATTTSTSTTTSSSSTTTTQPPPLPRPGRVALFQGWLTLDPGTGGEVSVFLGDPLEEVRDAFASRLGLPDAETGFGADPDCVGDAVNVISYGDLRLVFLDGFAGEGAQTFEQWFVVGVEPAGLVTTDGIGFGATMAQVRRVVELGELDPVGGGESVSFELDIGNGTPIFVVATGPGDDELVTGLWSGDACDLLEE